MSHYRNLKDFVGVHKLSGVQFGVYTDDNLYYGTTTQQLFLVLNGETWVFTEDPNDGYRSMLRDRVSRADDVNIINRFPDIRVAAIMRQITDEDDDDSYGYLETCEILDMIDLRSGKRVVSLGTGNTNDYYPYCVMKFQPENLHVNLELDWTAKIDRRDTETEDETVDDADGDFDWADEDTSLLSKPNRIRTQ